MFICCMMKWIYVSVLCYMLHHMNRSMHSLSHSPYSPSFAPPLLSFFVYFSGCVWVGGWYMRYAMFAGSCLSCWKHISFCNATEKQTTFRFFPKLLSLCPSFLHHPPCVLPSFSCFLLASSLSVYSCMLLPNWNAWRVATGYISVEEKKLCSISVVYGRDAIKVMVIEEMEREIIIFCVYNYNMRVHSLVRVFFLIKCNEIWYTHHRSLSSG